MIWSFSSSAMTVPENGPWIESRRSRLARFSTSLSFCGRRTIARRRSLAPEPARSIRIRARSRPIRPKPYSTTSVGSSRSRPCPVITLDSSSCRYASRSSVSASWKPAASFPMSILAESSCIVVRATRTGIVSWTDSSRSMKFRAYRWAFMISIDVRVSFLPKMYKMTSLSR